MKNQTDEQFASLVKQLKRGELTRCQHFNGTHNKKCKALVEYDDVAEPPSPGKPLRLPCLSVGTFAGPDLACPSKRFLDDDEAEIAAALTASRMYASAEAMGAAKKDAKAKGYGKGKAGAGSVPCTVCGNTLRYTVAALNGHVHGRCSTRGCVSWME